MDVIEFDHGVLRSTRMQDASLIVYFGSRRIDMSKLLAWGREFGDLFFRDDKDDAWVRFGDSAEAIKAFDAIMRAIKDGDRLIQFNREMVGGQAVTTACCLKDTQKE